MSRERLIDAAAGRGDAKRILSSRLTELAVKAGLGDVILLNLSGEAAGNSRVELIR